MLKLELYITCIGAHTAFYTADTETTHTLVSILILEERKVHPRTDHEGPEVEVQLYSFFNIGARWCGWSTPRLGRFTHRE